MQLPPEIAETVQPLFEQLPLDAAMDRLVVANGSNAELRETVETIARHSTITPPLAAGLWLYVDDLDRSHTISQSLKNATGSFWHGIMHRREGDFGNSHYWFRNTGEHPAMAEIEGYDPHGFIDEVQKRHASNPAELVGLQRREWAALFSWCARNAH